MDVTDVFVVTREDRKVVFDPWIVNSMRAARTLCLGAYSSVEDAWKGIQRDIEVLHIEGIRTRFTSTSPWPCYDGVVITEKGGATEYRIERHVLNQFCD